MKSKKNIKWSNVCVLSVQWIYYQFKINLLLFEWTWSFPNAQHRIKFFIEFSLFWLMLITWIWCNNVQYSDWLKISTRWKQYIIRKVDFSLHKRIFRYNLHEKNKTKQTQKWTFHRSHIKYSIDIKSIINPIGFCFCLYFTTAPFFFSFRNLVELFTRDVMDVCLCVCGLTVGGWCAILTWPITAPYCTDCTSWWVNGLSPFSGKHKKYNRN